MSDSFADLWASSAPTKSAMQKQLNKVGSATPPRRQQYDAFSILSSSQPSSRPVMGNQPRELQAQQPQPTSHGGDAFGDLFASSRDGIAASRNPECTNMTMAERAVLAQKAKIAHNNIVSSQVDYTQHSSSLWDGLDALARPATVSPRPSAFQHGNTTAGGGSDFGFDVISSTAYPSNKPSIEDDDWGLSEFGSSVAQASHPQSEVPSRSLIGTPGNFDFGNREDFSGDNSDIEDTFGIRGDPPEPSKGDILGDLGKPVSHSNSPSPNPSTVRGHPPTHRSASPPPHVTGQLVEMGFSPADARIALINTMSENNFDVQAATELLLSQASQGGSMRLSPHQRHINGDREGDRDQVACRPPRGDKQPSNPSPNYLQSQSQLDITAEKLLSQATEIGRGMFSKANALWKEGKERAAKIYEERAAATTGFTNGAPTSDTRPRWMRDRDHAGTGWQRSDQSDGRGVVRAESKDDEDEGQEAEEMESQRCSAHRLLQSQAMPTPPQAGHARDVDLLTSEPPTIVYQSPFRHRKPKLQAPQPSVQSSPSPSAPHTELPTSTSSDMSTCQHQPHPPRTFITTIALSALVTSTTHKSAGTDAYKRGDFPAALASYTRALSALPPEHILRLPILTNVALVRSKVGELRDTIKACEEAVVIVRRFTSDSSRNGLDRGKAEMFVTEIDSNFDEKKQVQVGSGKVSVSWQGDGSAIPSGDLPTSVDLVEGLSKAFRRRAEALEGLEKWDAARSMWETLLAAEWAGASAKVEAVKGVGRCRKMVGGADLGSQSASLVPISQTSAAPRLRPKLPPKSSASPPPSAALTALRSTHNVQQIEDAVRLDCKDTVDARLSSWKSGREGNIRALLASLDETVLWPELGWRKVSLAEVVSKAQVKGAYVRAIARVHPDKLNAKNTTVEQRMIANGVFGALNEAWNVFQQQSALS